MNIRDRANKPKKIIKRKTVSQTVQNKLDCFNSVLWKPTDIPDGFVIVVDTREQYPLFDPIPKGLAVIRDTVKIGDYTIMGLETKVAIERKCESDFFSYIGSERIKTTKKLEAMSNMYFSALVIQVDEYDLYNPSIPTKLTHEHVRGFLKCIRVKYGIHYYMNEDREMLERYVLDSLTYAYKQLKSVDISNGDKKEK
jgi:ERCC4-type nuclease